MAVRETFAFDTGPNGAAIGVSGDIVAVTGATYTTAAMHGAFAMGIADGTQNIKITNSGTATHSGSIYVKVASNPGSGAARIVTFTNTAGSVLMSFRMHSDGHIDIANNPGAREVASSMSWTAGSWYRFDWQWDGTTQAAPILTLRIFATPEGTTASETITWTASGLAAAIQRWQVGMIASGGVIYAGSIDTMRISDGLEWIGPFGTPPPPSPGTVVQAIAGAPSQTSFGVVSKLSGATSVRLKVATDSGLTANVTWVSAQTPDSLGYVRHTPTGLSAGTQYYYQLADTPSGSTESLIGSVGKAKTLKAIGTPQNFTVALGSCITQAAADPTAMNDWTTYNADVNIFTGDFDYSGTQSTVLSTQVGVYETQISSSAGLSNMIANAWGFYCRSDHEAGPDNGDSNNTYTATNIAAAQQVFPWGTLGDTTNTPVHGLYQSWVVGRVRFIMVDIRNIDRSTGTNTDDGSKTMLGAQQLAWLKSQLVMSEPLKVIVSDVAWMGANDTVTKPDAWWSYDTEREAIISYINTNISQVQNVMLWHGDTHAVAVATPAKNTWGGFPVYCGSPLHNTGGGRDLSTFSSYYNNSGGNARQYGRISITDDGTTITSVFSGWDATNQVQQVTQTDTFAAPSLDGKGKFWDSTSGTWKPFTPKVQQAGVMTTAKAKVWDGTKWVTTKGE